MLLRLEAALPDLCAAWQSLMMLDQCVGNIWLGSDVTMLYSSRIKSICMHGMGRVRLQIGLAGFA